MFCPPPRDFVDIGQMMVAAVALCNRLALLPFPQKLEGTVVAG